MFVSVDKGENSSGKTMGKDGHDAKRKFINGKVVPYQLTGASRDARCYLSHSHDLLGRTSASSVRALASYFLDLQLGVATLQTGSTPGQAKSGPRLMKKRS